MGSSACEFVRTHCERVLDEKVPKSRNMTFSAAQGRADLGKQDVDGRVRGARGHQGLCGVAFHRMGFAH